MISLESQQTAHESRGVNSENKHQYHGQAAHHTNVKAPKLFTFLYYKY